MSRALAAIVLAGALLAAPAAGRAAQLVADLSNHLVAITTGFVGTEVLLFGAIEGPGDVVVVVRGPSTEVVMHRKSRVAGIWMNTATMTFERVPSFYAVHASGPLEEVAREPVRARQQMGIDHLRIDLPRAKASPNVAAQWKQALIRAKQRQRLYPRQAGDVVFLGARLFRATVYFPANVPTGSYQVEVYLLRDGRVVSAQTTPLIVSKVGLEAELYDFAYEEAGAYGLVAIVLALVAGWLAHSLFRKA